MPYGPVHEVTCPTCGSWTDNDDLRPSKFANGGWACPLCYPTIEPVDFLDQLRSIAEQIVKDVNTAGKTGDLDRLYRLMVANRDDIKTLFKEHGWNVRPAEV